MDSNQKSKLKMYITVRDFLNKNLNTLNGLPSIQSFLAALLAAITQIQLTGAQHALDDTGIEDNKSALRKTLITLAADTARKLAAFAMISKNAILSKEVNVTESSLNRLTELELHDTAQAIYDRAQQNIAAVAAYQITAATQTALLNSVVSFNGAISKSRGKTVDNSQGRSQIDAQIANADEALRNIDKLVDIIKLPQAVFYKAYKDSRKIIKTSKSKQSIKGIIVDAESGIALKNTTILIEQTKSADSKALTDQQVIKKKSAEKGGFNASNLADGTYTITVQLPGYKTQVITITVVSGKLTNVKIKLVKG